MLITASNEPSAAKESYFGSISDPFIQEWDYFDGINIFKLTIQKSPMPEQDYALKYTFLGGSSSTAMCKITSPTSFKCVSGDMVTRDDVTHSVKITSPLGSYVFYDPNYMPPASDVLGKWHAEYQSSYYVNYDIQIRRGSKEMEYLVTTSYSDDRGNHCYDNTPLVYYAEKTSDGSELIHRDQQPYYSFRFKYDPLMKQIANPNADQKFSIGFCIDDTADRSIVFSKK